MKRLPDMARTKKHFSASGIWAMFALTALSVFGNSVAPSDAFASRHHHRARHHYSTTHHHRTTHHYRTARHHQAKHFSFGNIPAVNADSRKIIAYVALHLEGPGLVKNDNGYGYSKFGIVGHFNGLTDEQVSNLTLSAATNIYKRNYWDVAHISRLPPKIRLFAFHTVILCGTNRGQAMIEQAHGDPRELLKLCSERCERLAQKQRFAGSREGWRNRIRFLTGVLDHQDQNGSESAGSFFFAESTEGSDSSKLSSEKLASTKTYGSPHRKETANPIKGGFVFAQKTITARVSKAPTSFLAKLENTLFPAAEAEVLAEVRSYNNFSTYPRWAPLVLLPLIPLGFSVAYRVGGKDSAAKAGEDSGTLEGDFPNTDTPPEGGEPCPPAEGTLGDDSNNSSAKKKGASWRPTLEAEPFPGLSAKERKAFQDIFGQNTCTPEPSGRAWRVQYTETSYVIVKKGQVTLEGEDGIEASLRYAAQAWGGKCVMTGGTVEFKDKMRAAAQKLVDDGEVPSGFSIKGLGVFKKASPTPPSRGWRFWQRKNPASPSTAPK